MRILLFITLIAFSAHAQQFKPIFNNKNLMGWYTFLEKQGKNKDTIQNFKVENGAIHVLGKEFGYLASDKSYGNFHLVLEFKWGTKKFPPREQEKRDAGVLYRVQKNGDKIWPKCIEFQIQEGDVGDIWLVDSTAINVNGATTPKLPYYRVQKFKDNEKPNGEWNKVEVIAKDGKVTHISNGVVVNEGTGLEILEGKILLQSEGAEIYYRNIRIAEL
jgi:hypothetical protein